MHNLQRFAIIVLRLAFVAASLPIPVVLHGQVSLNKFNAYSTKQIAAQPASPNLSPEQKLNNSQDPQAAALRDLMTQLEEAWNRGDAATWAKFFTDDARFVTLRGDVAVGRAAIEANHRFIFGSIYKGTQNRTAIESMVFPSPGVAIVDLLHNVTNFAALPPGVNATEPGVLRARMRFIAVLHEGTWRFVAAQNTGVFPKPTTSGPGGPAGTP